MKKKSLAALSVSAIVLASLSLSSCGNRAPKELPASEATVVEEVEATATIGLILRLIWVMVSQSRFPHHQHLHQLSSPRTM